MRTTATVALMLVRLCGTVQIVLGLLFWSGNAVTLVPVHILVGLLLVLSLWTLAFVAARSGVQPGFVAFVFVWGLVLPVLGLTQGQILQGGAHWVIQLIHLLVGLGAIGQAEGLRRQMKQAEARVAA